METSVIQNETFINLLADLGIPNYTPSSNARKLLETESKYIKDLKINVSNVLLNSQHLTKKEALLLAYSVAVNEKFDLLKDSFAQLSLLAGATDKELAEVVACTSLLNVNNVFYRFRHFMHKDFYSNQQAGIKMGIMLNPVLGKEFFELASLVVSALNGCELCVTSHEQSVLKHGSSEARVFEAVKLGAVIKGLITVLS